MTLEYESNISQPENSKLPSLADAINQEFQLNRPEELLVIADTLTLTFNGNDYHLSTLDAYTNKHVWKVSSTHNVPAIKGKGLLLAEPSSFEDGRCIFNSIPKYEIAPNQSWVRVVLREVDSDEHYEVASTLVIGLKGKTITDIYLLNVAFL
jgi:hypothetical protein